MKGFINRVIPGILSLTVFLGISIPDSFAQLAIQVLDPQKKPMEVTGRNIPRGDEALILYDRHFGKTTRTNAFGVEVTAVPAAKDGKVYEVKTVTSVWKCHSQNKDQSVDAEKQCGNAVIPEQGVVLSAMGKKRELLKNLKPGDLLTLKDDWYQQVQSQIDIVNPTPLNNPAGSGFPGFRASNQLDLYNAQYGAPTTGTNEFGFEVTVRNGIVVAQEGSDSTIPQDGGYVLSGHGRGRSWLIAHAPVGAKMEVSPDGRILTSSIDFDTYAYQFDQRWAQSTCADKVWTMNATVDSSCNVLRDQREKALRLFQDGQPELAAATMQKALEGMNQKIWLSYKAFPADTVRGAWHRPVEKTSLAIGQTLDRLKAAGINSVFLETFFHGYTIFPSKTYKAYGLPEENPKFAGADLLQLWLQEAHKRNMKVHVWFQTFYGGTKAYLSPGPILTKYPTWANVQYSALVSVPANLTAPAGESQSATARSSNPAANGSFLNPSSNPSSVSSMPILPTVKKSPDHPVASTLELGGFFLDPANPQVQSFLMKLATEIVTRYDVDGFQLDYIRYPASFPSDRFSYRKTTWGYTDTARNAFKAQYRIDPVDIDPKNPQYATLWQEWNQYKTEQINDFVQRASTSLRQIRPSIKISAAIFPEIDRSIALKHQNWLFWGQNGWVDFFAPMTLTSAVKVVERDTRNMVTATRGSIPIYSGIFGPFNDNTAEHVLYQIDTAKQAGAKGYVLFDTAHLTPQMIEALKIVQVSQKPATEPPVSTSEEKTSPVLPISSDGSQKHRWWRKK